MENEALSQRRYQILERVSQVSGVGGWELDLVNGRLWWSAETCAIHGLKPDFEPTLDEAIHFYAPESQPVITELVEKAIESGEGFSSELRLVRADGEMIWVRAICEVDGSGSDVEALFGTFQDITQEREIREELRQQNEALRQTRDQQDRVFAIVGHELSTPAAATLMLLEEAEHSGSTAERLNEAKIYVRQLLHIIRDMRLVTQRESSLHSTDLDETVDVFAALKSATSALQPLAEAEQFLVELRSDLSTAEKLHLGSTSKIIQATQNLVKNAILHSGGNEVQIQLTTTSISDSDDRFVIRVSDNGKGIDAEFQTRMYQAFERNESESAGSGLGLAVVKQLVENLPEGRLAYSKSSSGGASFTIEFSLPRAQNGGGNQRDSKQSAASEVLSNKRVLIVEDTPTLRLLTEALLKRVGAEVASAEDGFQALERLSDFSPDLVLTDIMMPNMNGFELVSALRNRGFEKPIIGITGATIGMEAQRLIDLGADQVIAKPLTLESLISVLRVMDQRMLTK